MRARTYRHSVQRAACRAAHFCVALSAERHGQPGDSVAPCAFRYGYTFLVPALGWVVCKYILSIPLELMTLLTLYGYSLVTFLPSAVCHVTSHRIASHRPAFPTVGTSRNALCVCASVRPPAVSNLFPSPARPPARS